jgi:hypothetical protein
MSVCVSLLLLHGNGSVKCIPPLGARQRLIKHIPMAMNTRNSRRIVVCAIFCSVCVLSKESLWIYLCIPLSLLGNNSVKMFPQQWRIVGGIVFYAVCVLSKESSRLVLPRTYCLVCNLSIANNFKHKFTEHLQF